MASTTCDRCWKLEQRKLNADCQARLESAPPKNAKHYIDTQESCVVGNASHKDKHNQSRWELSCIPKLQD